MSTLLDALFQTPEQIAERERILAERFYLVKQGSLGEIFRCGLCQGKHPYLTLRCVEQPFSGVEGGLLAYVKVMGTPGVLLRMRQDERRQLRAIRKLVKSLDDMPDLSRGHPQWAQQISAADQLGPRDGAMASIALGVLEAIPRSLAQRLLDRINGRGGKLTVPGLSSEG